MADSDLRKGLIRLAYENPDMRSKLLPLLKVGGLDPALHHLVEEFKAYVTRTIEEAYAKSYGSEVPPTITVEYGRRYARLVKSNASGSQVSVFGFIDLTNGDLLKAATFKAPAAGARGNLYDKDTWRGSHSEFGMAYRR